MQTAVLLRSTPTVNLVLDASLMDRQMEACQAMESTPYLIGTSLSSIQCHARGRRAAASQYRLFHPVLYEICACRERIEQWKSCHRFRHPEVSVPEDSSCIRHHLILPRRQHELADYST